MAPIRLAVLDVDSGLLQVVRKRLEGGGWRLCVLASPVAVDSITAMRPHAFVLDPALLGSQPWACLERLCAELPHVGVVVCTGRSSVAQRVRGLRMARTTG